MKSVKGYIQRKTMLYETGVEYGDYTMNHVPSCAHGCKFPCYAFMILNTAGIKCTTLTKGLLPIELATLSKDNEHGITLIFLDESYREKME